MKHPGLEALLTMTAVAMSRGVGRQRTHFKAREPRQKTEVEAWNEAVEKRKAEKKARKLNKDNP